MDPETAILCPACKGSMHNHRVSELAVYLCEDCGGAWFGSGQLDTLVNRGPAALDELAAAAALEPDGPHEVHGTGATSCPKCVFPLKPTGYRGKATVHLSICYKCGGIFIDATSIRTLDSMGHEPLGLVSRTYGRPDPEHEPDPQARLVYHGIPPGPYANERLAERVFGDAVAKILRRFLGR